MLAVHRGVLSVPRSPPSVEVRGGAVDSCLLTIRRRTIAVSSGLRAHFARLLDRSFV